MSISITSIWKWVRGEPWVCRCIDRQGEGRAAQVKFVVSLGEHRFSRYVDTDVPGLLGMVVAEIVAAAPDRGLTLSPRAIQKLRKALELAYASLVAG